MIETLALKFKGMLVVDLAAYSPERSTTCALAVVAITMIIESRNLFINTILRPIFL